MSMSVVLYREHPSADWREVDVIGPHASGNVVLREVGPALPGVFLGDPAGIRVPVEPGLTAEQSAALSAALARLVAAMRGGLH